VTTPPNPDGLPAARAADGLPYDVFISYRHAEPGRTWVREVLAPGLEAAGVRVLIDHRDFRLGEAIVTEQERAVEQSRYTLAVLTPAYLESNFTELESVLAEHLGLETSQRRLIAVVRERTRPRLGLRARLSLDMTDDAKFQENLATLVQALSLPSSRSK
jgi:hypothetical protein